MVRHWNRLSKEVVKPLSLEELKQCGGGTSARGLMATAVLGQWLDFIILEVFYDFCEMS